MGLCGGPLSRVERWRGAIEFARIACGSSAGARGSRWGSWKPPGLEKKEKLGGCAGHTGAAQLSRDQPISVSGAQIATRDPFEDDSVCSSPPTASATRLATAHSSVRPRSGSSCHAASDRSG